MVSVLLLVTLLSSALIVNAGDCLTDWNTNQPASAWNTRLFWYWGKRTASISSSSTLNFMTYNLQSSISNACQSNPVTQAGIMNGFDYVGNQEVVQGVDTRCSSCNMPQVIADNTGMSTRFLMTFPWRTGQYGIGAGTSQTIVESKYFLYNTNSEQRGLLSLRTYPPALGGKALHFIATHLDFTVPTARWAQAQQLVQWVRDNIISKDSSASVVIVGDFNCGYGDNAYNTMTTLFKNAWEVKYGSGGGFTYPSNWPTTRFDHLWFYTPASVSATVMSAEVVNTQASDHRPLKVSIKFTTSGAPAAAATSAPTSAPTTKAPVTSAPTTKAPTAAPTSAPSSGGCSASLSYDATSHNIFIKNTGTKAIKTLELKFSPSLPSNSWNWVATSTASTYTLPSWAWSSLEVGKTYTSSGFYPTASKPETYSISRISC